jgi:DNA-binding NtrC family response regulator
MRTEINILVVDDGKAITDALQQGLQDKVIAGKPNSSMG